MSPRVCLGVGAICVLLSLTAGVILWGALRSGQSYESLRRQAIREGLPLSLPRFIEDQDMVALVNVLKTEFVYIQSASNSDSFKSFRENVELAKSIRPKVLKIASREPNSSRWESDHYHALRRGLDLCTYRAYVALFDGDEKSFINELEAIRGLCSGVRTMDSGSAYTRLMLVNAYCRLSLLAAEDSKSSEFVRALEANAARLPKTDFRLAASHLTAERLEVIELDRYEFKSLPDGDAFDLAATIKYSEPLSNKERAKAIESGLQIAAKWDRTDAMLEMRERDDHVSWDAWSLKRNELECELLIDALKAALRAHLNRTRGMPWPTMESLEAEGFRTVHGFDGETFGWSPGTPKRVTSYRHSDPSLARTEVIDTDYDLRSGWGQELVSRLKAKQ